MWALGGGVLYYKVTTSICWKHFNHGVNRQPLTTASTLNPSDQVSVVSSTLDAPLNFTCRCTICCQSLSRKATPPKTHPRGQLFQVKKSIWALRELKFPSRQLAAIATSGIALHGRLGGLVHAGQFARIADGLRRTPSIPRPSDQIETISQSEVPPVISDAWRIETVS